MGESSDSASDPATADGRGPLAAYRARRREGHLRHDPGQLLAAEKLQSLHNALRGYQPAGNGGGWKARLGLARRRADPPQGLYIFGGVGTGKSMLMDLFFETAGVTPNGHFGGSDISRSVGEELRHRHHTAVHGTHRAGNDRL